MKVAEDAAQELPLNDEKLPVKKGRRVSFAINHIKKQREVALEQRAKLTKEIEKLDAAILALD